MGQCSAEAVGNKDRAVEVVWHFNAIFDHVYVCYEPVRDENALML